MIRLTPSELTSSPALSRAAARLSDLSDAAAADYANASTASGAWGSMRPDLVTVQQDECGWYESALDERAIEVDHILGPGDAVGHQGVRTPAPTGCLVQPAQRAAAARRAQPRAGASRSCTSAGGWVASTAVKASVMR